MHERKFRQPQDVEEEQSVIINEAVIERDIEDPSLLLDELKKRQSPSILQIAVAVIVLIFVVVYSLDLVRRHDESMAAIHKKYIEVDQSRHEVHSKAFRATSLISTQAPEIVSLPEGCIDHIPTNHFTQSHIVPPPEGPVTLVCCTTTKGIFNIAVHPTWAPLGSGRFLDMVTSKFFSSRVPLFRALKGFLVQFGLNGDTKVQQQFDRKGNLKDDPQWLPPGPPGRKINGVSRFQKGYMAYAGGGPNTRDTQLIMAFEDSQYLGGGSPWEVPWGQLVGDTSFETMSKIYTGYGEAPDQGKIRNRGAAYIDLEFPLIDYVNACEVIKEGLPWKYTPKATVGEGAAML